MDILTDPAGTGTGAPILITIGGGINVSGTPGNAGGSARNDGTPGVTDDPSMLAVRLRAGTGSITNSGTIWANGAPFDGNGGDILFIGSGPGGSPVPVPGTQFRGGQGAGSNGSFAGL